MALPNCVGITLTPSSHHLLASVAHSEAHSMHKFKNTHKEPTSHTVKLQPRVKGSITLGYHSQLNRRDYSIQAARVRMVDKNTEVMAPWWVRYTRWSQTSLKEAAYAEKGLLSLIPRHNLTAANVKVGPGPSDWLHTITNAPIPAANLMPSKHQPPAAADMPAPNVPSSAPLVLMPGYGAGAGFFFRNLGHLAAAARLYAVDWLGTGLSGRPKYTAKTREQAEAFFVDSLAQWRQQAGIGNERMVLVGHSLGGYLAAAYALAHPEHVEHLVLVCPAGVPKAPEDWQQKFLGGRSGWRGSMFKAAMWAWESGITPHSIIRALGPWGPGLCERYVVNRFVHHGDGLSPSEVHWFKQYFYSIIAQQGSGEYALRHLLAPGAWAYEPLANRLRELKVPVTFIYGAHDWMRPEHAVQLCKELKQERQPKVPHDLHVEIIQDAGHFVFIDQPELFNQALLNVCSKLSQGATPATGGPSSDTPDATVWGTAKEDPSAATY